MWLGFRNLEALWGWGLGTLMGFGALGLDPVAKPSLVLPSRQLQALSCLPAPLMDATLRDNSPAFQTMAGVWLEGGV
jgi:hypothetical protein